MYLQTEGCFPVNFDRGLKTASYVLKYRGTTKYLGLILNGNLTWESHIKELNKKLIEYTGIFSKISHCLLQFKHIRTPLRNLHRQFNTLKLKDLHYFNSCCTVQKFIHLLNLLPEAINDIVCQNDQIHDHDTRNKKRSPSSENKNKNVW